MKKLFVHLTRLYNIAKLVLFSWFLCILTTILVVLVHRTHIYQPNEYSKFYEWCVMSRIPPSGLDSSTSYVSYEMILSMISTVTSNFLSSWQKVVVLSIAFQFIFYDGRGILLAYLPLPKWMLGESSLDLDDSDLPALELDPKLIGDNIDLTHAEFRFVRRGESHLSSLSNKLKQPQGSGSPCISPRDSTTQRNEFVFHPVYGTIPREVLDLWASQENQKETAPRKQKLPPVRGSSGNSAQNSPVNFDRKKSSTDRNGLS